MRLDVAARRNLELTETMRNREKRGTLFWVLDKTKTSMGRRLLRSSIEQPLLSVNAINRRLHAVTELTRNSILISELAAELDGVYDLERLMTRVVYGNPPVKDMIALGQTAMRLPAVKELLGGVQCALLREIEQNIDPLEDVARLIGAAIDPDDSTPLKEGGVIHGKRMPPAFGRCASGTTGCSAIISRSPIPSGIRSRHIIFASRH